MLLVGLKRFKKIKNVVSLTEEIQQNFKLERGARQGYPISAYWFILVLEIFFIFVKNNLKVKGLKIFRHEFL